MNASSNIYDMHHIYELCRTLMTWWCHHTDWFQNEIMPLLHGTLQLHSDCTTYLIKEVRRLSLRQKVCH